MALPSDGAVRIERAVCHDLERSSKLEWLETDGTGSFAMGTVAGLATRRYHGLLAAALRPPVSRHMLLARVEDTAVLDGHRVPLATAQHPGVIAPQGFSRLSEFRLDPLPTWEFDVEGARLTKRLFLVHGRRTVVIRWQCDRPCSLRARPFVAFRPLHAVTHENPALDKRLGLTPGRLALRPYATLPELWLCHDAVRFEREPLWYRRHELAAEIDRGFEETEDLWTPGVLEFSLTPDSPGAVLVGTLDPHLRVDAATADALETAERDRRRALVSPASRGDPRRECLERAADQFLVRPTGSHAAVMAGYPWFTVWGRDTMIALPGLLVARGRVAEAEDVLAGLLGHLDHGVVPNRFVDEHEDPEYGTVDATLLAFVAMRAILEAGGGAELLRDLLWPRALEIVDAHVRGTRHGIRVDPTDGLLAAGEPGFALTWMDAKIDGRAITPRIGKPVEVQALWHHALVSLSEWGTALGRPGPARAFAARAAVVAASFRSAFWSPDRGHLVDVLGPDGPDARLRPNQIFAVSLPCGLLGPDEQRAVVRAVETHLLTPFGLRTLAPFEDGYQSRYAGDLLQRDTAYHQGTVWPWLLGPFVTARLRAFGRTPDNLAECRAFLEPLARHLTGDGCLGSVSEIFDGDPPHRAVGAPAQAWSVSELLRLWAIELAE